ATEAVLASPVPLLAVATRLPDYSPVVLRDFHSSAELLDALRASARIPLITGKAVSIGDRRYIDGSMTESIPLRAAKDAGADRFFALLTRPTGEVRREATRKDHWVTYPLMNLVSRGL